MDATRIQRQFPDHVVVELAIRKPFAQVRVAGKKEYFLVDRTGVRLPTAPSKTLFQGLPAITDYPLLMPEVGQTLESRSLEDAFLVMETVVKTMKEINPAAALTVTGIEIGRLEPLGPQSRRRLTVTARTRKGKTTRIVWGPHFRQGETAPHVVPAQTEKLRWLKAHLIGVSRSGRAALYIDVSVPRGVHVLADS